MGIIHPLLHRAGATEGEIIGALTAVWGRYRPGM